MSQHLTGRAARSLAMIFCATALVACGGGDDPPAAQNPNPNPQPGADFVFATPSSATATAESGKVQTYNFAQNGGDQTVGTLEFAGGALSYSASLASDQTFAGIGVRETAPNDAVLNASSYTQLKIQLKSSTDGLLNVKLQPNPVPDNGGCVPTASVVVNSTMNEVVIDLDEKAFTLRSDCNQGTSPSLATVKAGLYAIDAANEVKTAGNHDLSIGTIKLVP